MPPWADSTSYSRGERGTVAPRSWTLDLVELRIVVHRHIDHPPDQWLVSCNELALGKRLIRSAGEPLTAEQAQASALRMVRSRLCAMLAACDNS